MARILIEKRDGAGMQPTQLSLYFRQKEVETVNDFKNSVTALSDYYHQSVNRLSDNY